MKTKVTYILSNINKAIAFEWIAEKINKELFDISFILLHNSEPFLYSWLKERSIETYYIPHFGKKSYPKSTLKVLRILRNIKPTVVHTHLFDANLIGLSSAKLLGIKKRIYTRHHSTFHHNNFPKAVKYDNWCNKLATDIVAISENVNKVLTTLEDINPLKISLISHGFDLYKFSNPPPIEVEALKQKYNIDQGPVVGIISRYINWKGIQYIIPAFKNILKKYPNAILVLANADGPDKKTIKKVLESIPEKNYREIIFEQNLFALYQLFDIYVHTPIDNQIEAFGQTYVEALAAKKPSIFTLSGIANEFIIDKKNALVVPYKNASSIEKSILILLKDQKLKQSLIENGQKSVEQFNLVNFVKNLEKLYS